MGTNFSGVNPKAEQNGANYARPQRAPHLPLKAMRAFCAVARTRSIQAAAEYLSVTPSAISHQIRLLEQEVGQKLIVSARGGILLTTDGEQFAARTIVAFDALEAGMSNLGRYRPLTLDVCPVLATERIAEGLALAEARLQSPVRVTYGSFRLDRELEPFDAALRMGTPDSPAHAHHVVGALCMRAFCATEFASNALHMLQLPVLRANDLPYAEHQAAITALGLDRHASTFADSTLSAMLLAASGLGIAIAPTLLVKTAGASMALTTIGSKDRSFDIAASLWFRAGDVRAERFLHLERILRAYVRIDQQLGKADRSGSVTEEP